MSLVSYKANNHPQQAGRRGAKPEIDDTGSRHDRKICKGCNGSGWEIAKPHIDAQRQKLLRIADAETGQRTFDVEGVDQAEAARLQRLEDEALAAERAEERAAQSEPAKKPRKAAAARKPVGATVHAINR